MYSILEVSKERLESLIPKIRNQLSEFKSLSSSEKINAKERIKRDVEKAKKEVTLLELNIGLAQGSDIQDFTLFLGRTKEDMLDIDTQLKALDHVGQKNIAGGLFGDAGMRDAEEVELDFGNMAGQEVINHGDRYQEKTVEVAHKIQRTLKDTHKIADDIIIEEEKISKEFKFIDSELSKMDSSMKRITKFINYFGRHYMGDKIIMGCICVILVIILVIFIMSFVSDNVGDTSDLV